MIWQRENNFSSVQKLQHENSNHANSPASARFAPFNSSRASLCPPRLSASSLSLSRTRRGVLLSISHESPRLFPRPTPNFPQKTGATATDCSSLLYEIRRELHLPSEILFVHIGCRTWCAAGLPDLFVCLFRSALVLHNAKFRRFLLVDRLRWR